jgi:hypothetical protein
VFILANISWIFFRANNLQHAISIVSEIFTESFFTVPKFPGIDDTLPILIIIVIFFVIEWKGRINQFALARMGLNWPQSVRHGFYLLIIFSIFWFGGEEQQFIYFNF